jgi:hypothetical protein
VNQDIRPAAVAGRGIRRQGDQLARQVDEYLEAAEGTPPVAEISSR